MIDSVRPSKSCGQTLMGGGGYCRIRGEVAVGRRRSGLKVRYLRARSAWMPGCVVAVGTSAAKVEVFGGSVANAGNVCADHFCIARGRLHVGSAPAGDPDRRETWRASFRIER